MSTTKNAVLNCYLVKEGGGGGGGIRKLEGGVYWWGNFSRLKG